MAELKRPAPGILVVDDVFPAAYRARLEQAITGLSFDIAFPDRFDTHEKYVNASVPDEFLAEHDVLGELRKTPLAGYADYPMLSATANMDTPGTPHYCHIHAGQFVFLYYVGGSWKHEWGGETLYFDRHKREILWASPYTPNRAIFFDGRLPHTIRAPTTQVPHPRLSFGIFFQKAKGPFEEL